MQFPVPQFTDVEDRIVAGLSFKQFGIVFAAGVLVFIVYTLTKSIFVTIVAGIFIGLPALALTFGKLNGRPLYSSAGNFVRFMFGPKLFVFRKQALDQVETKEPIQIQEAAPPKDLKATAVKIKELNYLLQQQASEEATLLQRIQDNKKQTNFS